MIVSSARARVRSTLYGSHGVANIMYRKLSTKPSEFCGYMIGLPMLYL